MSIVSIIMPTYNSESFILDTINSVVKQTFESWELIIVDDCSSDNTVKIIKKKFGHDKRIHIFENEMNSGAGVSRNNGLIQSKGKYIAFLDSDDIWHENKLEVQIDAMSKHDFDITHTSYSFINEDGTKAKGRVLVSDCVDLDSYMKNTEIGMSTAVINKEKVGDFQFNAMRTRQDTKLWLTLLAKGITSKGIDNELVYYRVRQGQISRNKLSVGFRTLKLYMTVKEISLWERLYNFMFYTVNGFKKRM